MTIAFDVAAALEDLAAGEYAAANVAVAGGGGDFAVPDLATSTASDSAQAVRFDGKITATKEAQIFRHLEANVKGISKGIDGIIASAVGDVATLAQAAEGRAKDLIRARHRPPRELHATHTQTVAKLAQRVWKVLHVDMVNLYNRVTTEDITRLTFVADVLERQLTQLRDWTAATFDQVVNDYSQRIAALGGWTAATFARVVDDYLSRIATETGRAVQSERNIVAWADAAITTETNRAVSSERAIEDWAATAIGAEMARAITAERTITTWAGETIDATAKRTIAYTDTEVASPVAGRYPELQQSQVTMLNDLAVLAPAALAGLSTLPQLAPQTARQAVNAVTTKLETCEEWINQAGSPLAKQLGKFPHDLSQLLGATELAVIVAFIVAAVEDPEGTAAAAVDVGETVLTPLGQAIDAVVGISL